MATEGIKYLYYSFLLLINDDSRYRDDNKLLNSYIHNIKDDNNFYLMKISQMLKKFPDLMVKIDPLIYKAYSDDLYFHIIKNHPYFAAAAASAAVPPAFAAAAAAAAVAAAAAAAAVPAVPAISPTANVAVPIIAAAAGRADADAVRAAAGAGAGAAAAVAAGATNLIAVAAVNAANAAELAVPAIAPIASVFPAGSAPANATNFKIKLFCDLILFDILCRMDFNRFDPSICESNKIIIKFLKNIIHINPTPSSYNGIITYIDDTGSINTNTTRKNFLIENKRGLYARNHIKILQFIWT